MLFKDGSVLLVAESISFCAMVNDQQPQSLSGVGVGVGVGVDVGAIDGVGVGDGHVGHSPFVQAFKGTKVPVSSTFNPLDGPSLVAIKHPDPL